MRLTHRAVQLVLCVVAGLALVTAVPASATPAKQAPAGGTTSSWTLLDVQQRMCLTASGGHPGTYFLAPIYGAWSRTITTGIRKLPAGSSSAGGTTLPPGSNYSSVVNGFVQASIAPAPAGLYTAEVWASDGVETQAVPVRIYMLEHNLDGCPPS